ncbi:hypothetical protein FJ251_15295 [bacterium]|nr:hypothetical protein [bacterium]
MQARRLIPLLLLLTLPVAALAEGYQRAPISRESALLRSAFIPGLGQIEQGRTGRGALWAGGAAALVGGTFFAHMEYHSAAKDMENAEASYRRAVAGGQGIAAHAQLLEMKRLAPIADDRYDLRRNLEIGLALWWAGNLVDTWLFGGPADSAAAGDGAALPGHLTPVLQRGAAGLAWTIAF